MSKIDKNILTNIIASLLFIIGLVLDDTLITMVGLFALSGALTNWLAIYMLFERIPGLVGSGVIPAQFEAFKTAIKTMMMTQFFTQDNIARFVVANHLKSTLQLAPVIQKVDLSPSFDKLVKVIMNSSFGSILGMFGGVSALTPLKEPFIISMKESIVEITQTDAFHQLLQNEIDKPMAIANIRNKIVDMIDARLQELTPDLVKEMVQRMIKQHLGWLVVWGGVLGGLIGLISAVITIL